MEYNSRIADDGWIVRRLSSSLGGTLASYSVAYLQNVFPHCGTRFVEVPHARFLGAKKRSTTHNITTKRAKWDALDWRTADRE